MDIKVNTKPAEDTNELSIADGTFVANTTPATGLEDLEGKKTTTKAKPHAKEAAPKSKNPTPTVIREMVEDAAHGNSDEASIPTMMMDLRGNRTRNIAIGAAVGAVLIVALVILGRSGGSTSETALADTTHVAGASDDTETAETNAAGEDDAVLDLTDLEAIGGTDELKGAYDAEKCATPATDREWLECAAAAYSDLRIEQKRLTARVAELEARPAPSVPYSNRLILFLGVAVGGMALLIVILQMMLMFRKRKGSGHSAP